MMSCYKFYEVVKYGEDEEVLFSGTAVEVAEFLGIKRSSVVNKNTQRQSGKKSGRYVRLQKPDITKIFGKFEEEKICEVEDIGQLIRTLREEFKMTRQKLVERTGISHGCITVSERYSKRSEMCRMRDIFAGLGYDMKILLLKKDEIENEDG